MDDSELGLIFTKYEDYNHKLSLYGFTQAVEEILEIERQKRGTCEWTLFGTGDKAEYSQVMGSMCPCYVIPVYVFKQGTKTCPSCGKTIKLIGVSE